MAFDICQFSSMASEKAIKLMTLLPPSGFCGYISIMLITSSHQTPNGHGARRIYVSPTPISPFPTELQLLAGKKKKN